MSLKMITNGSNYKVDCLGESWDDFYLFVVGLNLSVFFWVRVDCWGGEGQNVEKCSGNTAENWTDPVNLNGEFD